MPSILVITTAENLQDEISKALYSLQGYWILYVSLNKNASSTENALNHSGIKTAKTFYIDCVSDQKAKDVIHVNPDEPEMLNFAITRYLKNMPQKKLIVIDALSTLMIYNSENKVAKLVKQIINISEKNKATLIAFSPKTEGEELLTKIFNFFDRVEKR